MRHIDVPQPDMVSDRFNLENGAGYFPAPPERYTRDGGFVFPDPDPAVRYLASGPLLHHLGAVGDDPVILQKPQDLARDRIASEIDAQGSFRVHSEARCFILEKPGGRASPARSGTDRAGFPPDTANRSG